MACKIIGAELVGRVKAKLRQILGPGGEHSPVTCRIVGITLDHCQRGCENEHVAGLLDGHVLAIGLPVGQRIGTHVMRREGFGPPSVLAIVKDMVHHPLDQ